MNFSNRGAKTGLRRAVLTALGLSVIGMAAAYADPVTTWGFEVSTQFDTTQTVFTSGNGPTTNTATELAWGVGQFNPPDQSSLVINPSTGTGSTDTFLGSIGGATLTAAGVTLTHNNFPILLSSHILSSAVLNNSITLTPTNPAGSALSPFSLNFGINFDETPNSGSCPVAPLPGFGPCPDIFVVDRNSLDQQFSYDGQDYFLNMVPLNNDGVLGTLPDAACAAAGVANGCFGFVTQENSSNPLNFGLAISTQPQFTAPEPSDLGIMGLGLFGLAGLLFLRRRKDAENVA